MKEIEKRITPLEEKMKEIEKAIERLNRIVGDLETDIIEIKDKFEIY